MSSNKMTAQTAASLDCLVDKLFASNTNVAMLKKYLTSNIFKLLKDRTTNFDGTFKSVIHSGT